MLALTKARCWHLPQAHIHMPLELMAMCNGCWRHDAEHSIGNQGTRQRQGNAVSYSGTRSLSVLARLPASPGCTRPEFHSRRICEFGFGFRAVDV